MRVKTFSTLETDTELSLVPVAIRVLELALSVWQVILKKPCVLIPIRIDFGTRVEFSLNESAF